jgi:hypothetical protein
MVLFSESVAYEWGPKPGLIRYYYDIKKRPDTQVDALSVGFITPLQNSVLLRIDSATTNDYLELEIVIFNRNLFRNSFLKYTCLFKK